MIWRVEILVSLDLEKLKASGMSTLGTFPMSLPVCTRVGLHGSTPLPNRTRLLSSYENFLGWAQWAAAGLKYTLVRWMPLDALIGSVAAHAALQDVSMLTPTEN